MLAGNVFKTLVNQALSLKSWSDFRMVGNTIQFMDFGALSGISNPGLDANKLYTGKKIFIPDPNAP